MFRVRQIPKSFFRSTSSISQIQAEKLQKFKGEISLSLRAVGQRGANYRMLSNFYESRERPDTKIGQFFRQN